MMMTQDWPQAPQVDAQLGASGARRWPHSQHRRKRRDFHQRCHHHHHHHPSHGHSLGREHDDCNHQQSLDRRLRHEHSPLTRSVQRPRPARCHCWSPLTLFLIASWLVSSTSCSPERLPVARLARLSADNRGAFWRQLLLQLNSSIADLDPQDSRAALAEQYGSELEWLAERLVGWPDQREAGLLGADLIEAMASSGRQHPLTCPHKLDGLSLAALLGDPANPISADSAGFGARPEAQWAPSATGSGRTGRELVLASYAKAAVDNANLISKLLLHFVGPQQQQQSVESSSPSNQDQDLDQPEVRATNKQQLNLRQEFDSSQFYAFVLDSKARELINSTTLASSWSSLAWRASLGFQPRPQPQPQKPEVSNEHSNSNSKYNHHSNFQFHSMGLILESATTNNISGQSKFKMIVASRDKQAPKLSNSNSNSNPKTIITSALSDKLAPLQVSQSSLDMDDGIMSYPFVEHWLSDMDSPPDWSVYSGDPTSASTRHFRPAKPSGGLVQADGRWFWPQLACGLAWGRPRWLATYSVPLFGDPNSRGISFVALEVGPPNQCASAEASSMGASHKCSQLSGSQCVPLTQQHGDRQTTTSLAGNYACVCHRGSSGVPLGLAAAERHRTSLVDTLLANKPPEGLTAALLGSSRPLDELAAERRLSNARQLLKSANPGAGGGGFIESGWLLELDTKLAILSGQTIAPVHCRPQQSNSSCATGSLKNDTLDGAAQPSMDPSDCARDQPSEPTVASLFRPIVIILQWLSTVIVAMLALILLRLRKSRVILASGWLMLETCLLGAVLLHSSVLVRALTAPPTSLGCLLERWLRELGFSLFYGSLLIKLYTILTEFQSRKAHRVCLRDRDQIVYLLSLVVIVVGYMGAWTALMLDGFIASDSGQLPGAPSGILEGADELLTDEEVEPQEGNLVRLFAGLLDQHHFYDPTLGAIVGAPRCRKLTWDYVTESSELLLLICGLRLVYKLRNAQGDSHKEKLVLGLSIAIEMLVSGTFYVIRHSLWGQLAPDQILLLHFARNQLTVTVSLALVLGPKLLAVGKSKPSLLLAALGLAGGERGAPRVPQRHRCHINCELHDHHLADATTLHEAMLSSSALNIGTIDLSDMDPDEIKVELKRVYSQLELMKTKIMKRDNPHISKRRGGRKNSHRKFSLQAFHSKHLASHFATHQQQQQASDSPTSKAAAAAAGTATGSAGLMADMAPIDHLSLQHHHHGQPAAIVGQTTLRLSVHDERDEDEASEVAAASATTPAALDEPPTLATQTGKGNPTRRNPAEAGEPHRLPLFKRKTVRLAEMSSMANSAGSQTTTSDCLATPTLDT